MTHKNLNNIIHNLQNKYTRLTVGQLFLLCANLYISSIFTRCVFFNNMGKYILRSMYITILLKHIYKDTQILKV